MKSKKFEDLRGTNTAIHCPTPEEAEQVEKICGFENISHFWDVNQEKFCISLDEKDGGFSHKDYFKRQGHTIIPAADFIAANNKQAPDPSNPLPPLPSEGVEAEKVEAKIDIEKFAKAFNDNMKIIEERLDLMVDLHDKLQGKVESLEKQLSEVAPKQINETDLKELSDRLTEQLAKETKESFEKWLSENRAKSKQPNTAEPAISQTPSEPEVKLPVTIDEVFSGAPKGSKSYVIQSDGNIHEYEFNEIDRVDEYRKESTAKKVRAFIILQKISEAQNEIEPRGETVWFAELDISKNEIGTKKRYVDSFAHGYGLIAFHSEQGLKDCIAANRELWMDLLKGE